MLVSKLIHKMKRKLFYNEKSAFKTSSSVWMTLSSHAVKFIFSFKIWYSRNWSLLVLLNTPGKSVNLAVPSFRVLQIRSLIHISVQNYIFSKDGKSFLQASRFHKIIFCAHLSSSTDQTVAFIQDKLCVDHSTETKKISNVRKQTLQYHKSNTYHCKLCHFLQVLPRIMPLWSRRCAVVAERAYAFLPWVKWGMFRVQQ